MSAPGEAERAPTVAATRMEELRSWLREHLPPERPRGFQARSWQLVVAYAAGASIDSLAEQRGQRRDLTMQALRAAGRQLGYEVPPSTAWLTAEGIVAPHAARQDPETGCLLWSGPIAAGETGPRAQLPVLQRVSGPRKRRGRWVMVRRHLWEQHGRPVGPDEVVAAGCGDRRCIALEHATVRPNRTARKPVRPMETIARPPRKRAGRPATATAMQTWLATNLPTERPDSVTDRDWDLVRRYITGRTLQDLADEDGVTRQWVHFRLRRLAARLGQGTEP